MSANPSYGAVLKKGTTVIADVLTISLSGMSRAEIDVTALADSEKKYLMGTVDSGTVDLSFNYDSGLSAYIPDSTKNVSEGWSISWTTTPGASPTQQTIAFNAFVQSFSASAAVDQQITSSLTLRVDGAFVFTGS